MKVQVEFFEIDDKVYMEIQFKDLTIAKTTYKSKAKWKDSLYQISRHHKAALRTMVPAQG